MSELWTVLPVLAAGVVGVVLGALLRGAVGRGAGGRRVGGRRPRADRTAAEVADRDRLRELRHAADDLEYGLNTVLDFGPLAASELGSVDLPAKLDRIARTNAVDHDTLRDLRAHTERIALHPYPERRDLLTAVREDDASVWLVLREAVGSGAAQHQAATQAREVLDVIRAGLRESDAREELVAV
ncbi:hypothetical protein [Actinosynnema sp. NPDC023587]|uniref:hypothetical protein n=1 Tax=Actinosynnema sp. NPDC023587 TaxID=3154695 RepID=UPI0033FE8C83